MRGDLRSANRHWRVHSGRAVAGPDRCARVLALLAVGLSFGASAATFHLPLLPPGSDALREGVVRIVNHAQKAGEVSIAVVDDTGARFGPITVSIEAGQTIEFSASDLERGNAQLGIDTGIGVGQGDWRLELDTDLPIEPTAHVQAPSGFLDRLDRVVPGGSFYYRVALPAPDAPLPDGGRLRLVNASDAASRIVLFGLDDTARLAPQWISLTLPPRGSRTMTARALEQGGNGLVGSFGDGQGDWRVLVFAGTPLDAMVLLDHPSGPLANLSGGLAGGGKIHFFPAAGGAHRDGLLRIGSRSGAGAATVHAVDDAGNAYGPVALDLEAGRTVVLDSADIEQGLADEGLPAGIGDGEGDWRIRIDSALELDIAAYVRTQDGLLTSVRETAEEARLRHYVPRFGPADETGTSNLLRLINATDQPADVAIIAWDDDGMLAPGGAVSLTLAAGESRSLDTAALEQGAAGLNGQLGEGRGRWRLAIRSDRDIRAMNLAESSAGHLTNAGTSATLDHFPEACFDGPDADGNGVADACKRAQTRLLAAACADGRYVADPGDNPGLVGDCRALVEIANALTEGAELPADHPLLGWGAEENLELTSWAGIEVEGGRVVGLDLSGSRAAPGVLDGPVPDALGQLSALKSLDLSYNTFSGAVPTALGLLTGLERLDLSSNRLSGAVPGELARLPLLRALNVENNRLTGRLPWAYRDRLIEDGLVVLYGGNAIDGLVSPPPRGMPPVFSDDPFDNGNASHHSVALYQGPLVWERTGNEAAVEHQEPVFGRWAVLVVNIEHRTAAPPPVRVRVTDASGAVVTAQLAEAALPSTASTGPGRWRTEYAFELPGSLNRAGHRLVSVIDPDDDMAETDESDNVAQPIMLYGQQAPRLRITFIPVKFPGREPLSLDADVLMRGIHAFWPVADDVEAVVAPALESDASNQYVLLQEIRAMWNAEADPDEFYFGIFAQPWTGGRGVAYRPGRVAVSEFSELNTIPHEFGHNLNLRHPPGCDARNADRNYPYPDGQLGPLPVWDAVWHTAVSGDDPTYGDVMSNCGSHRLVSDYHYGKAWRNWRSGAAVQPTAVRPTIHWSGPSWNGPVAPLQNQVWGTQRHGSLALSGGIDEQDRWTLTHAQASSKGPRTPAPGGTYFLVLMDGNGLELHRESLSADSVSHGGAGGWAARVPLPPRIPREVAIVDARGVTVMRTALPAVE